MAHATGKVLEEMVEILAIRHKSVAAGVGTVNKHCPDPSCSKHVWR